MAPTRAFAGAFGTSAGSARPALERALGTTSLAVVAASRGAVAWTDAAARPGETRRAAVIVGSTRSTQAESRQALGDALDGDPSALALLRGTFAGAALDADQDRGLLVVDHLGGGGLFIHESTGCLWFASELDTLVRLIPATPAPRRAGIAQWLADGYLEPGETLYERISRLGGGQIVRIIAGEVSIEQYWAPKYVEPAAQTLQESGVVLRSGLERAVSSSLRGVEGAGVLLSGGLDSSIVAGIATASEQMSDGLAVLTLAYPDHTDADESALVDEVARGLGSRVTRLEMRGADALGVSLDLQARSRAPLSTPMAAFTFPLLQRAEHDGIQVVLDGEGGDELFGCSPYLIADELRRGRLLGATRLARRLPESVYDARVVPALGRYGVKGLIPHRAHRIVRSKRSSTRYAPDWLEPASRVLYVEARDNWSWKRRSGPHWWAFLAGLLTSWRQQLGVHDYLRLRDGVVGIEGRHPLLDDVDLIELVLRLPPEHAFARDVTRPVAREAVRGLIPDRVRLRRGKADFSRLLVESIGGLGLPLARDLLGPGAELRAHVRGDYLRRVLSVPDDRRNVAWARLVWRLATIEVWLRTETDRAAIEPQLEAHARRTATPPRGR